MSIGMCKVNNLFTIKRVSVYVFVYGWVRVDDRWMECLGGGVNRIVCGDGMVWGGEIG